jgi:hypothetical protein
MKKNQRNLLSERRSGNLEEEDKKPFSVQALHTQNSMRIGTVMKIFGLSFIDNLPLDSEFCHQRNISLHLLEHLLFAHAGGYVRALIAAFQSSPE